MIPAGMFNFGLTDIPLILLVLWHTVFEVILETLADISGIPSLANIFTSWEYFINFLLFGLIFGLILAGFKNRSMLLWGFLSGLFPPCIIVLLCLSKVKTDPA